MKQETKKNNCPINGVIEPDFLEYLEKKFKQWQRYHSEGISIGSREIAALENTVKGAKMNAHLGFEYMIELDTKREYIRLEIFGNKEKKAAGEPIYTFEARMCR